MTDKNNKFCISCNQKGHTYLECPKNPFFDLFSRAVGVEPITPQLDRETHLENLEKLNKENGSNSKN